MSLIGLRVIVLETAGSSGKTLRAGFIRAASDPAYINEDISQIKVCVQFDDRDACDVQWVNLTDSSVFQSVYINTGLVWARRSLHTSGRNSVVGWPARSFSFFAGEDAYKQMVVVEYFDDKEKVSLPMAHVRKLEVSEAVSFLTQQQTNMSSMLGELRQWEEHQKLMKLLLQDPVSLVGCHLMIFRCYSSPWFSAIVTSHDLSTRELMVTDSAVLQEHSIHPAVVQVKLQANRSVDEVVADLSSSRPRMGRRSSFSTDSQLHMRTQPPPPHISDYPPSLNVWQSPEQCTSMPWFGGDPNASSGITSGTGMTGMTSGTGMAARGVGTGTGNGNQNGMHCQDNVSTIQYEGQPIDEGGQNKKKGTIEYRNNDSGSYLNPKKEPDSDIKDSVDISSTSSNFPPTSTNNNSTGDGSMNPPTITPTKIQLPFSPTTPLPPHLQSNSNYATPQSTLMRTESLPQIPQTFGAPSSMDNYPNLFGNRAEGYPFAPPPMHPRPALRQVFSAVNLTALNPTRDIYEPPVLPKRAPLPNFAPPPAKKPHTLQRCFSQPNIPATNHHQTLDHLMSILSEEQELPEPEPSDVDMFTGSSSNIMSPHVPWGGCYPEPGQLSQISAMSMPVLNNPDQYTNYDYLSSSQHIQHSMRTSEPYLNQLPLQSTGYVPSMERPPAHVAKPPEILDAQGQESDQSSECSIFQYENRLNSTGAVEQHRSDSSDTMLRGGLLAYHQTGSLPNINEMSSHSMFHNRLDPEDPSDNVFNSPLTGRNSIPYFDFGTGGGVMKNSTSSNQEAKRGRGRPRLSPREKKQREELRIRGLIARNKKRRSKEEMELAKQYKAPGKRGRKAGFKRNSTRESWFAHTANGSVILQSVFCDRCPGVSQCRECHQKQGTNSSDYCRFLDFRRLKVDQEEGTLTTVGFADNSDVTREALIPWIPLKAGYSGMDKDSALYVLSYVAKNFVTIMFDELRAIESWKDSDTKPLYWKKAVKGVREMCDTCDTTIFNTHWTCEQCGFTVCNTCYFQCLSGSSNQVSSSNCWPPCICSSDKQESSTTQPHSPSNLLLVHIIPDIVLWKEVFLQLVELCHHNKVTLPQCDRLLQYASRRVNQLQSSEKSHAANGSAAMSEHAAKEGEENADNLLYQLISSSQEEEGNDVSWDKMESTKHCTNNSACDCYDCHGDHSVSSTNEETIPPRVYNNDTGHLATLCENRMLWIKNCTHEGNISTFQEHWRRGEDFQIFASAKRKGKHVIIPFQPILVSGIHQQLSRELWSPQSFIRDFGNEVADLVDCYEGLVIRDCSVSHFWDGFENLDVRLKDNTGTNYRLLKLKDWPTRDDFCDKLPQRYDDLVSAKPIPEYTRRDGKLNIAASLPHFFVRPDLGPKMYSAYGCATTPDCSTTNLHLDIADAVNVMVYSTIPKGSCDPNYAINEAALIDEVVAKECCSQTIERLRNSNDQVGAIWHIYSPSDAPKIRALLAKACEENYQDYRQPPGTDPIHDQCFYLTSELRKRLLEEYGVQGYTIAQCVGDAIFIPAGAPHQVRNLCSCIKVAEDFVSPEHMNRCLQLTEEFRHLSENHSNHEDKLQVKNILYHTMKDIVGILTTSKLPVAKVTKAAAKTTPPKLSKSMSIPGIMATDGNARLSSSAVAC